MLLEIDKDFYCSAGASEDCPDACMFTEKSFRDDIERCKECICCHRKHPSPAQFREEYGFDYPDDGAVYCHTFDGGGYSWVAGEYEWAKEYRNDFEPIVCACTPWGKPDKNWRPE